MYPATISNRHQSNHSEIDIDKTKCSGLLGKLQYLNHSRPDIRTAVSYNASINRPTINDYEKLLDLVRYLLITKDKGLILYPSENSIDEPVVPTCYVDASYLSHMDGKSHSGYIIGFGDIPKSYFYSKSAKQKLVATSSTHAEIRALYELTLKLIYITSIFQEIGREVRTPIIIHEDNQPVIDLTNPDKIINGTIKSKHFVMICEFIKEKCREGLLALLKCPTEKNESNVMTKIVVGNEFHQSLTDILGTPI